MRPYLLSATIALSSCWLLPNVGFAETGQSVVSQAEEAVLRVNVAGRQRMLSQRMVKAACLMAQDVDAATAFDQLTQSYDLFVRSDVALREGDSNIGLSRENFGVVRAALQTIDQPWSIQQLVVEKSIDTADVSQSELLAMNGASLDVLRNMNAAVFTTAQAHAAAAPKVSLGVAVTVDIAGRQRMLSQRAVKEACLLHLGHAPQETAETLRATIDLFNISLAALQTGHEGGGIVAPTSPEVARKLADVADLWRPIKDSLDLAVRQQDISARDLAKLARDTEPLLRTMNEAVGLYSE